MKVYELLAKPDAWTQRALARAENGVPVRAYDPCATAWCFYAAILICYPDHAQRRQVLLAVGDRVGDWITDWNDVRSRTHEEVVQVARDLDI